MSLQMERPGIGGRGQKADGSWPFRIAYIHHGDAIAKHVTDIGVSSVDHDLYPIPSSSLVGVTHKVNIFTRGVQGFITHDLFTFLTKKPDMHYSFVSLVAHATRDVPVCI